MERVRFVPYLGKQLLLLDFSKLSASEVVALVEQAKRFISAQPPNSLLTLTDVTGTLFNDEAANAFRDYVTHNKPYVRAAAVVGVTGLKKIILNVIKTASRRDFELFDTIPAAQDWLAGRK